MIFTKQKKNKTKKEIGTKKIALKKNNKTTRKNINHHIK